MIKTIASLTFVILALAGCTVQPVYPVGTYYNPPVVVSTPVIVSPPIFYAPAPVYYHRPYIHRCFRCY
jgi:hypothetical protein